ncbi:MAG: DUF1127 domain-containing protein [Pseudomonadota bacterium]
MDHEQQRNLYDDHFERVRRLDRSALLRQISVARSRAARQMLRLVARHVRSVATRISVSLVSALRRNELVEYDDRLLRDMGLSRYDLQRPRRGLWHTVETWLRRSRERTQLARFTERDLHDIGLGRTDANMEVEKPFWRA